MRTQNIISILFLALFQVFTVHYCFAQFAPPAGQPGTTAMHRDSSAFIGWADTCIVTRGYINIADTLFSYNGSNKATYGSYLYATGPSDEYVVSLGDHGSVILGFDTPVADGPGPDFAVFENSFGDLFLELAFVEVSSDGQNFVRFPAISNIPENEQITTFGTIDATQIHNFAGKYRMGYGTPFDLTELKDSSGIDINRITHIRIVDVGGCLFPEFAVYDSQGHKVNDPWPTPFDTGGFDLDAIGVIHNIFQGICPGGLMTQPTLFPNPMVDILTLDPGLCRNADFYLMNTNGEQVIHKNISGKATIEISDMRSGLYIARIILEDGSSHIRKLIKK